MNTVTMKTPIGEITLQASGMGLTSCTFSTNSKSKVSSTKDPILIQAKQELLQYFSGIKIEFKTPLSLQGTKFQKRVWDILKNTQWGDTTTYGEMAFTINNPKASRAVGNALGKNPLLIFIPCHRVLAAHSIGGFSSGLDRKKFLLKLERSE